MDRSSNVTSKKPFFQKDVITTVVERGTLHSSARCGFQAHSGSAAVLYHYGVITDVVFVYYTGNNYSTFASTFHSVSHRSTTNIPAFVY